MTLVYLVRHAHVPAVTEARPDPPLSPLGRGQAEVVAARLSARVDHPRLYSSPARRSYETALIIGGRLGVGVRLNQDLVEIQGTGAADEEARDGVSERWRSGDRAARLPGGETLGQALDRFRAVIHGVASDADSDVVLISHGAFVAMGLLHLCEHDADPLRVPRLAHCALVELETGPARSPTLGRVRSWNRNPTD